MADHNGERDGRQMRVDSALVRELAELLATNELSEIEVEDGDRKIRVRRELMAAPVAAPQPMMMAPSPVAAAPAASAAADSTPELPAGDVVKSPMVGTCYLSAEPGSKPFVAAGESVKEGDTLVIVEAMKVMNPIIATRSGIVRQVLVANAQPVEFDQPLIVIG